MRFLAWILMKIFPTPPGTDVKATKRDSTKEVAEFEKRRAE